MRNRRESARGGPDSERRPERDLRTDALNHVPAKIARTYNRATYDAEKRQALAILGDLIESIASGDEARSNVVHLA
jgi:hypothetical protein